MISCIYACKVKSAVNLQGIVTAPILFAIEEFPELRPIVDRGFDEPGDVDLVSAWFTFKRTAF